MAARRRSTRSFAGAMAAVLVVLLLGTASTPAVGREAAATQAVVGWPMFHHDPAHTGIASGVGTIPHHGPPTLRWTYRVFGPLSDADMQAVRWTASFPLGDLDGNGTLEAVVTTPNQISPLERRVIVLKDDPEAPGGVSVLWEQNISLGNSEIGIDQYSSALADADGDGLADVILSTGDGILLALDGNEDGALIWSYDTHHITESGPMLGDLDGDGSTEVLLTTGCEVGAGCADPFNAQGKLYVFAADPPRSPSTNKPLWSKTFASKADSGPPAVADLDPKDGRALHQVVMGAWDAKLHVIWRDHGTTYDKSLSLLSLDDTLPPDTDAVMRTSPMIVKKFGGAGSTAVFGWMPDWTKDEDARLSAVGIKVNTERHRVTFTPRWTPPAKVVDTWKSSPTLVPALAGSGEDQRLSVQGYGIDPAPGPFVTCGDEVFGGVVAVNPDGSTNWEYPLPTGFGSVRASAAVADVDGDTRPDVLIPAGCQGALYALDGQTGDLEWSYQLGPYTINAPSIADLDADGSIEIVVGSSDGQVYALGGP